MRSDMRKHVEDLAEHRGSATELFRTVSYDGPPELFSMYCCIFLCGSNDQLDINSKRSSKVELIKSCEKFTAKWGLPPRPVMLLDGTA